MSHNILLNQSKPWHTLTVAKVFEHLNTSSNGLTSAEARERLLKYGANELTQGAKLSPFRIFINQAKSPLIIILLLASLVSVFLGHGIEAVAIAVIVIFSVSLGFVQEYRAEKALEALQRLVSPTAKVLRSGQELSIPAAELVPGDIVLLEAGDKVPADLRLTKSINLKIDESVLTGESVPSEKHDQELTAVELPLGDRRNLAYYGTNVTYGRGMGVVVGTGMRTEFGRIAGMLQKVETVITPLQKNLTSLSKNLGRAALIIILIIVGLGLAQGQAVLTMLIFGIALAVAVVPEALPAVVTISLAIGVQRMVKRHVLVRYLPAVETLGSVSVICTDKTGTLTKNEMTVRQIYCNESIVEVSGAGYEPQGEFTIAGRKVTHDHTLTMLLTAVSLCSDARLREQNGVWQISGDPTEGALVVAAAKAGIIKDVIDDKFPRTAEVPFTAETKSMVTFHKTSDKIIGYSKGAPEVILPLCTFKQTNSGPVLCDQQARQQILATAQAMAAKALRVLAVAYIPDSQAPNSENQQVFLGLVGMIDPPRAEAQEAVAKCYKAGIRVVMITGDHPTTAQAIAQELGILQNGQIIVGLDLEKMDQQTLINQVKNISVYARVSPAHKLRVVEAWQSHGAVVAMTGDGVNDAPALKRADVGIAMGITGTDVSREAAAVTLTDDNFASIVAGIEEGRGIFGNIKKYLMYLLSSNIGEIGLIGLATVLGLPVPLTAVQILYINLATDGLPALALAVDPVDSDIMQHSPRANTTSIFTKPVVRLMLVGGLWSALVNLVLFLWFKNNGYNILETTTVTFVSLALIQFFKAYNFRSDTRTVIKGLLANKWLNLAVIWELALLLLVLYVPFLQKYMGTFALTWFDWMLVTVAASSIFPVLELTKWLERRRGLI